MPWEDVIGKVQAVKILRNALISNHVAHAYLLIGQKGVGKRYLARIFAQALNCEESKENPCGKCLTCLKILHGNHPDVITIYPEGKTMKIEQVRELQKTMGYSAFDARHRVYVVCEVDKMTTEAANSLLKILEEPPKDVILILTAVQTEGILPTILSRCQIVPVHDIPLEGLKQFLQQENTNWSPEKVHLIASLAGGSIGKVQQFGQYEDLEKERNEYFDTFEKIPFLKEVSLFKIAAQWEAMKVGLADVLELLCTWYRDIMIYKTTHNSAYLFNLDQYDRVEKAGLVISIEQCVLLIDTIKEAQKKLRRNANVQLTLEVMLIQLNQIGKR